MTRKMTFGLVLVLSLGWPITLAADQIWAVSGGTTTLTFDDDIAAVAHSNAGRDGTGDRGGNSITIEIDPSTSTAVRVDAECGEVRTDGILSHRCNLTLRIGRSNLVISNPTLKQMRGPAFETQWCLAGDDNNGLILGRAKLGMAESGRLLILSPDLRLSPGLAEALGQPSLADRAIGKLIAEASVEWIGGDRVPSGPSDDAAPRDPPTNGPDMTFCQLYGLAQYGRLGDVVGLAVASTSWNIGNQDLMWFASPNTPHPYIVMNLYRLKAGRFEQIGMSSIKHGFYALGSTQCGGTCTFQPGHSQGDWLGQGCSDTYSSSLNAAQTGMAPRSEVNPWTGTWQYAGSHFSQPSHSHNAIENRLQVHDADLNPAQNAGALYYCEGYYAIQDDVNVMNSAAWKPVTITGTPGGTWTFAMSGASTMATSGFAIDAWTGATQTMLAQVVPPVEFVSPDGRCVLAAKCTDLGAGVWHYEYALLNIDAHRKVNSFTILLAPWITVSNIGFHAVETHEEPYTNNAWVATVRTTDIQWTTTDNPLCWGTLYNFRFDATAGPRTNAPVTLGLFEPGTPSTLSGTTIGPLIIPPDCNNNGVLDTIDIANGTSQDCNNNTLPDECELATNDCNNNGLPDNCELAGHDCDGDGVHDSCQLTNNDCDGNGVPDNCQGDCDHDGQIDACEILAGAEDCNTNGVPDLCEVSLPSTTASPNAAVPDGNTTGVSSVVAYWGGGIVTDVNVTVHIPHTAVSDLTLKLVHAGTTRTIWDNRCGSSDNLNVTFDDSGTFINCVQLGGTYTPVSCGGQTLSIFNGLPAAGDWTLNVVDRVATNTGTLQSWTLNVTSTIPPTTPLPDVNHNNVPDECECLACKGDANHDNTIDGRDVAILAGCMIGNAMNHCVDMDSNNIMNQADVSAFVSTALTSNSPCTP